MSPSTEDLRRQALADPSLPDPVRRALERGYSLEDIRLDRHGHWWHGGARIAHPRIADLFSRSVDRTEGGTYVLKIGRFTYPITVEDTPFFISAFRLEESGGKPMIRLTDGSEAVLDLASLELEEEGRLIARVKAGRFEARFLRTAYHDLLQHAVATEEGGVELQIAGQKATLK